jgi:hypothetical protein
MASVQFDEYSMYHQMPDSGALGPTTIIFYVGINCYFGGKRVGRLRIVDTDWYYSSAHHFIRDEGDPDQMLEAYIPLNRFDEVISTLRYEKPLWLTVNAGASAFISTGKEPVGEQEISHTP